MSAEPVNAAHPLLDHVGPWTEEDFLALPESEGYRVELDDGELHVIPAPTTKHQEVLVRLWMELHQRKAKGLKVVPGVNLRLGPMRILVPDIVVLRRTEEVVNRAADTAMAVEIVSRSGKFRDRKVKPMQYSEAGIPFYLRVELEPRLELFLYRREGSDYVEDARAGLGDRLEIAELGMTIEVDALLRDE